jgi:hypothetical protein
VGLERGPPRLVSIIEELLGRRSGGSGLENREYCRSVAWWNWAFFCLCLGLFGLLQNDAGRNEMAPLVLHPDCLPVLVETGADPALLFFCRHSCPHGLWPHSSSSCTRVIRGHAVAQLVEALCCKPECHRLESVGDYYDSVA